MRRAALILGVLGLAVTVPAGCGDDESDAGTSELKQQEPSVQEYVLPASAERTLEEQGRSGAGAALGDSELLPSEDGAQRLVETGAIDENAFCKADTKAFEAETLIEAERAFTRGWTEAGGDKVTGGAIYNALSVSCIG